MELNRIDTNVPRHMYGQPSSELSSSPSDPVSYTSTRDTTPDVCVKNSSVPPQLSTIEPSTPPSEHGSDTKDSSSSSLNSATAASSTSFGSLRSSVSSSAGGVKYHNTNAINQFPSAPRRYTAMSFNNGSPDERRVQHTTVMPPFNSQRHVRARQSSNWRVPAADPMDQPTLPTSINTGPDYRCSFQNQQSPQSAVSRYSGYGWFLAPSSPGGVYSPTAPTSFQGNGGTNSPIATSPLQLDLGDLLNQDFYGYGYDRGGGRFTLLVPVDMLPPIMGVPPVLNDRSGIVVLPVPPRRGPNGISSNPGPLSMRNVPTVAGTGDPVQHAANIRALRHQHLIDSITSASSSPPIPGGVHPPKRTKIYCDKWIHEGVCAFTQQGCKFKHEMPMDKATQHDLGLFQGLPSWWKKHQAELQRQQRYQDSETSDSPICLTGLGPSRETTARATENGRDSSLVQRDHLPNAGPSTTTTTCLTPPRAPAARPTISAAVNNNTNGSVSPVAAANGNTTTLGGMVSGGRQVNDTRGGGLGASRHNDASSAQPRSWQPVGNFAHFSSPYGPIGTPRRPVPPPPSPVDVNPFAMLPSSTQPTTKYLDDADDDNDHGEGVKLT
ncbi:hypothetical protein B0H66DRAFT_588388 [Apodospora peruviana]|uniref:C3H1-type domain-containing protein n=1 Tax=Apodospora peruviana TaxID=516989 RepID=A0AAE0IIM6_9PEZI|nr:hypothetical protein B0H66DRAFT_588388 [Apodospora peruviana]